MNNYFNKHSIFSIIRVTILESFTTNCWCKTQFNIDFATEELLI